jgi:hypothetical protein
MYARITTITGVTNLDAEVTHLEERVATEVMQMAGYRGLIASGDRTTGTVGVLGLWENEEALRSSDSVVSKVRAEAAQVFGGSVTVETFEQVIEETGAIPPAVGCALIIRRTNLEPARVNEGVEFLRVQAVPMVKETPGFRSLRVLIDRQSGDAIIGAVFDDQAALAAARERLEPPLFKDAEARNLDVGNASVRELLYIHRP